MKMSSIGLTDPRYLKMPGIDTITKEVKKKLLTIMLLTKKF